MSSITIYLYFHSSIKSRNMADEQMYVETLDLMTTDEMYFRIMEKVSTMEKKFESLETKNRK
jgi:hypothetical protein